MVGKEWLYVSARPYQCDGVGKKGLFPSMNFPDFAGNSRKYKSAVEFAMVFSITHRCVNLIRASCYSIEDNLTSVCDTEQYSIADGLFGDLADFG